MWLSQHVWYILKFHKAERAKWRNDQCCWLRPQILFLQHTSSAIDKVKFLTTKQWPSLISRIKFSVFFFFLIFGYAVQLECLNHIQPAPSNSPCHVLTSDNIYWQRKERWSLTHKANMESIPLSLRVIFLLLHFPSKLRWNKIPSRLGPERK